MRYTIAVVAVLLAVDVSACEVKLVFNRWCLGAPIAEQLTGAKVKLDTSKDGRRSVFVEDAKASSGFSMLSVYEDRISGVSRTYTPATALTYTDLLRQLTVLYGEPQDQSKYPGYAADWDSRELAIAVGKGRAYHVWMQQGFRIALRWSDRKSIFLTYSHLDLVKRAAQSRPSDL